MSETENEPEINEIPAPTPCFEPESLWSFCIPSARGSTYIAAWLVFWTVSLPIITEKFEVDTWGIWLGGNIVTLSIIFLLSLATGLLRHRASEIHYHSQHNEILELRRLLEAGLKREEEFVKAVAEQTKELAEISKVVKKHLPETHQLNKPNF